MEERRRVEDKHWDVVNSHMATTNEVLNGIREEIKGLKEARVIQNGRVGKLETSQSFQKGALWVIGAGFTMITTILLVLKK